MKRTPSICARGMALVIVLALIVVLTVILVSFVTQARFDASASTSFSQAVSVDHLAQDAVNTVVSSLLYEIEDGSAASTAGGVTLYAPKTALDVLPKWDASVSTDATVSALPNLIRTSRPGAIFGGSSRNLLASSVATDQPSLEGRRIGSARWNAPKLLPAANTALIPHWIYVNRLGPVDIGTTVTEAMTRPLDGSALNPEFIVGRYAYRIYDVSGLLDVNVAGYPSANGPSDDRIGRKGGLALAELSSVVTGMADGREFASWRWPMTGFADYVDGEGGYVNDGAGRTGFLVTPGGANRFLSRHDLLQYLQSSSPGADADQVGPQVTLFNRELDAPVWAPDADATSDARAMNPPVLSVRVDTPFERRDGTTARTGEPLVNRRFPLAKIALFDKPGANAAEIRKYFGLERNSDGTWRYLHGRVEDNTFNFSGDSGGTRVRLKTLAEIAEGNPGDAALAASGENDNAPREPNFFEMLQAGILLESLGQGANANNYSLQSTWADRNIDRHILQIGVNLIDQWDANDDPTVISRTAFQDLLSNATSDIGNPDPDISGVENLPYIYKIPWNFFRRHDREVTTGEDGNPVRPWVSAFYQFQLWNPHRNAASVNGTRKMRIVAVGSPLLNVKGKDTSNTAVAAASYFSRQNCVWPSGATWIAFDFSTSGGRDFSTPYTLRADDSFVRVASDETSQSRDEYVYSPAGYPDVSIVGFHAGSLKLPYTRLVPPAGGGDGRSHEERYNAYMPDSSTAARLVIQQLAGTATSFQLQKQDAAGRWLPVQTISCINKETYNYRVTQLVPGYGDDSGNLHANKVFFRSAYMTADPRGFRFGYPQMGTETGVSITADELLPDKAMVSTMVPGWLASNPGSTGWVNSGLALNRASGSAYYQDRGGTGPRDGDAASSGGNPYTTVDDRPIMLNRPFRSVAEMAYAHRGLPWKSVNFTGDLATPGAKNTADGALLDLFAIEEGPGMRAGVINLNAASAAAIKALLLKAEIVADRETVLSDAEADSAARAIFRYIHGTDDLRKVVDADHVLQTPADIARMVQALSSSGFSHWTKRKKDSLIAALVHAHSARTWNLALDVIAQTGRFPRAGGGSVDKFVVTGERRVLVHLALDRFTGEIIDQQVETVTE